MAEQQKSPVDKDEQELVRFLCGMMSNPNARKVAEIIRRMIENSLIDAGVRYDD